MTSDNSMNIQRKVIALLEQYQKDFPLRVTMPREEVRNHIGWSQFEFSAFINSLPPSIKLYGTGLKIKNWNPKLSEKNTKEFDLLKKELEINGLHVIKLNIDDELLGYLNATGQVINCGNGLILSAAQFAEVTNQITTYCKAKFSITLAEARDHLDTNRRIAQSILEELDKRKITKRNGDVRTLI